MEGKEKIEYLKDVLGDETYLELLNFTAITIQKKHGKDYEMKDALRLFNYYHLLLVSIGVGLGKEIKLEDLIIQLKINESELRSLGTFNSILDFIKIYQKYITIVEEHIKNRN